MKERELLAIMAAIVYAGAAGGYTPSSAVASSAAILREIDKSLTPVTEEQKLERFKGFFANLKRRVGRSVSAAGCNTGSSTSPLRGANGVAERPQSPRKE